MKRISVTVVLLLLVAAVASATSMIPKEVRVDAKSNGQTIHLFVGQVLSLSLRENPSTGFRWTVEDFKPSVLEQLETVYKPAAGVGGAGEKIFGFSAKRAGETNLELHYGRPWQETVPSEKFQVKLKVTKAGSPSNVHLADSGPRPGPVMNIGTISSIVQALADLKGNELKATSAIEFRPGETKEYVGLIIFRTGEERPRCPHEKLPMNNRALKNTVKNLVAHYGKKAEGKSLGFLTGGFSPPGFVQVTIVGTGLGLYFNKNTGEPMGKLTGKL